jgi:hypothetical protein
MAALAAAYAVLPLTDEEKLQLLYAAAANNKKDNNNWIEHHQ